MRQLLTAAEVGNLIALNAKRKEHELGKELNRLRMSERCFRKITGRRRHHAAFLADLNESLSDHNWYLVITADAIGLHKASAVLGWPRIDAHRINGDIIAARNGTLDWDSVEEELQPNIVEYDDEDDEA